MIITPGVYRMRCGRLATVYEIEPMAGAFHQAIGAYTNCDGIRESGTWRIDGRFPPRDSESMLDLVWPVTDVGEPLPGHDELGDFMGENC